MNKREALGMILFGIGVALLGEHIIVHGCSFSYPPWADHGLYGLISIIISFFLLAKHEN